MQQQFSVAIAARNALVDNGKGLDVGIEQHAGNDLHEARTAQEQPRAKDGFGHRLAKAGKAPPYQALSRVLAHC